MSEPLLSVRNLRVRFHTDGGVVRAVEGVSFDIERGETVALVGESGSGKTVTAESLMGLLRTPPADVGGEIRFDGIDVTGLDAERLRELRGGGVGHVFQNTEGALNPVYSVGWQLVEAIELHTDATGEQARARAIDLLDRVGLPDPEARFEDYPHQLSGGMRQRVGVAMALAAEPELLVADEPTSGLDVTIQDQLLRLLDEIQDDLGMSVLLITHDLGVVAALADRVVVLYAGKVMERAGVETLFDEPAHPYTRALLSCLPGRGMEPTPIPGTLPEPTDPPDGCRFHPRCSHAVTACETDDQPPLHDVTAGQTASCIYHGPDGDPERLGAWERGGRSDDETEGP